MKTYETEKYNIPEGATHYFNETSSDFFAWWDDVNKLMLTPDRNIGWDDRYDASGDVMHKIPQTKEAEWVNGQECRYNDINWIFCGFHPLNGLAIVANNDEPNTHQVITVDVDLLSKPETKEDREKRERDELADLDCESLFGESIQNCRPDVAATVRCMIEAGYRNDEINNEKSTLY